jgi:hypothetical protein
MVNQL